MTATVTERGAPYGPLRVSLMGAYQFSLHEFEGEPHRRPWWTASATLDVAEAVIPETFFDDVFGDEPSRVNGSYFLNHPVDVSVPGPTRLHAWMWLATVLRGLGCSRRVRPPFNAVVDGGSLRALMVSAPMRTESDAILRRPRSAHRFSVNGRDPAIIVP